MPHAFLALFALLCQGCAQNSDTPNETYEPCIGESGEPLPEAPLADRVDLYTPTFSDPTSVTNPLFPISNLSSAVLLGYIDGLPFHTETTLLPETEDLDVDGTVVRVLLSQYTAWLDNRIEEVALDRYAQADDGSVWYFGEDVTDFVDGVPDTHEGTWLAGRDGPAAMIMPADPQVGDAFNTENICPTVYEQVTITQVDVTLDGPNGAVDGAVIGNELHLDGAREDKYFAPGYGEFWTVDLGDLEAMGLANPTDILPGDAPSDLSDTRTNALAAFDAAAIDDWPAAEEAAAAVVGGWSDIVDDGLPPMFAQSPASQEVVVMSASIRAQDAIASRRAAVHVARWVRDLELRYLTPLEVDTARAALWAREILVDTEDGDAGGVMSDVTSLELVRVRLSAAGPELLAALDESLLSLRAAADAGDPDATTDAAQAIIDTLEG